ncbi:hypothetical protein [Candidatus Erwinia dacicola]|uniref:Uncharacterized protein n=1 Tax=Candidatus Erwinia dacicola TaxID=252393 RepID=A0A1E7Z3J4_9GAMM|nr:hypothetical protein [Candidatus Erwinia dacicola]OFC63339.1 hypothetical protein BBW68_05785 [Candidatus Erwinia dacicola]
MIKEDKIKNKQKEIEKGIVGILLSIFTLGFLLFMFGNSNITDCIISASTAGLFFTSLFTLYIVFIERVERVSDKKQKDSE